MTRSTFEDAPAAKPATPKEEEAALIAVLASQADLKDKFDACRRLAIVGSKGCVAPLAALLPDETLNHMARYALEPIAEPAVDEALLAALNSTKGRALVGVIASLGVRRTARAVEPLSAKLADPDPDVAQGTARALGRISGVAAAAALKKALGSAPPAVRLGIADGCLICAEAILAAGGSRAEAVSLYQAVAKAELPEYVRTAAAAAAKG